MTRLDWGIAAILLLTAPLWIAVWLIAGLLFGFVAVAGRFESYFTEDGTSGIVALLGFALLIPLSPILLLTSHAGGFLLRERLSCTAEGLHIRPFPFWRGTTFAWRDIVALREIHAVPHWHFSILLHSGVRHDLSPFVDVRLIEDELSARGIGIERDASDSRADVTARPE